MRWEFLDDLLEADHPARIVWAAVCTYLRPEILAPVRSRPERDTWARDATDPRLLVALWVFAIEGAWHAELARLCAECLPYQWLCGEVSVKYHMLSDFRSQAGEKWDELLTQVVATLLEAELMKMDRVAQDGMNVRASAGNGSFRRRGRLEESLEAARQQVETLKKLAEDSSTNWDADANMQRAGQATRERQQRDREEAMRECEELQKQRVCLAVIESRTPEPAPRRSNDGNSQRG